MQLFSLVRIRKLPIGRAASFHEVSETAIVLRDESLFFSLTSNVLHCIAVLSIDRFDFCVELESHSLKPILPTKHVCI